MKLTISTMSESMRERVNEVVRYQLAKGIMITDGYIDQGMSQTYVYDRYIFVSYTPWGVACIEQAFHERMRAPEAGESKRLIKRDIQKNPHLHPKIKRRLLKTLNRAQVRFDWVKHLDSTYIRQIMAGPTEALADEIRANTNLPEATRENLLFNLYERLPAS